MYHHPDDVDAVDADNEASDDEYDQQDDTNHNDDATKGQSQADHEEPQPTEIEQPKVTDPDDRFGFFCDFAIQNIFLYVLYIFP